MKAANEKAGVKSVGVARQYIGNVGKVCNAQVGVYAGLSRGDKVALVRARLYLPKSWTGDKKRMTRAGVPPKEQKYRIKPELAIEMVEQLEGVVGHHWVGGDTVYGNSPFPASGIARERKSVGLGCRRKSESVFG